MQAKIPICCNTQCPERFSCGKFSRAMDVNSGKILGNYYIIEKCEYEKG